MYDVQYNIHTLIYTVCTVLCHWPARYSFHSTHRPSRSRDLLHQPGPLFTATATPLEGDSQGPDGAICVSPIWAGIVRICIHITPKSVQDSVGAVVCGLLSHCCSAILYSYNSGCNNLLTSVLVLYICLVGALVIQVYCCSASPHSTLATLHCLYTVFL